MINFVGAGPGAPDLITVRGQQLIKEADIIIYAGSLVNGEILNWAKESCEIYNSAKMTLEEVLDVMKKGEEESKMTVRLHTGDPSVYGAIREQMDALDTFGIDYKVTPGVSSFCAAAAAVEKEYTLPSVSQSVIITRMKGRTPVPDRESIKSFAKHQATMVIFLSTGLVKEVSSELIEGGYSPDTKAALVYKASWAEEKIVYGTVGTLENMAKDNNITKTALILVGDFLGDKYEKSLLYDKTFTHEFRKGIE